ncbi:MAG: hypothetical protein GY862_03755 [Gammaproteobacteria bacterium]|nr:hypothetical protein [Gammaproteobacteria bacterium]
MLKNWEGGRQATAEALGRIGDASAVDSLIAVLKDKDSDVRQAAAEALGRIGDASAVDSLIAVLKDKDSDVRQVAAEALDELGWQPKADEIGATYWIAKRNWKQCVTIGETAVLPLIFALKDKNSDVRQAVAEALDKLDWQPKADEIGATYWIAKRNWKQCVTSGKAAVAPLTAVVEAWGYTVDARQAAVEALGQIADANAVASLIVALENQTWEVREVAAEALVKIGQPAVEPLIAALKDSEVRQAAVDALVKIGEPAVVPLIAEFKDSEVRQAAVDALVKIGQPAVEPLIAVLKDSDKDVREVAADVLEKIGWQPGKDKTGAWFWIAKRNWDKCVETGRPAAEPLIATLKDSDKDVRRAAAEALGQIGDSRAVGPLIAAFKDNNKDVHRAAANSLQQIRMVHFYPFPYFWIRGTLLTALLTFLISLLKRFERTWVFRPIPAMLFLGSLALTLMFLSGSVVFVWEVNAKASAVNWSFTGYVLGDGIINMALALFAACALGVSVVILSLRFRLWLCARRTTRLRVCRNDFHRFILLEPGLPWIVRWSGRLLAVENPRLHENFADYFVCRACGQQVFIEAERLVGMIGATAYPEIYMENRYVCMAVSLFDTAERIALSADIDRLEIHPSSGATEQDYDYAVTAVDIALSNDPHRTRKLKQIPIILHGNPPLSENTRRILKNHFRRVETGP